MPRSTPPGREIADPKGRPVTEIRVSSLVDSANRLQGLDYDDRMAVVFAAGTVVDRFVPEQDSAQLRRDYFAWVGLTMLFNLIRRTGARWGDGQPGQAVAGKQATGMNPGAVTISRLTAARREARRPENLVLNQVRADLLLPQYQSANYPVAIRQCRDELYQRSVAPGIFVPTLRLCSDIALELHRLAGNVQGVTPEAVKAQVASQRAFTVPGVKVPVTARLLALVLEYYGVATPARSSKRNGYRVRPWDLRRLIGMWEDHRIIQLSDLTWMQGRYVVEADRPADQRAPDTASSPAKT
jgi:hypothetical protein